MGKRHIVEEGLTFDDVLLLPGYSNIVPSETSLNIDLSDGIQLNMPIMSAAMDTVTEVPFAITLAQVGGIGVIHKNMSADDQASHVGRVKQYESVIVHNPKTIRSDAQIKQLYAIKEKHEISSIPVVDDGKLVGIVTDRDTRYARDSDATVSTIMTTSERLVKASPDVDHDTVRGLLHKERIEKVLLVDKQGNLQGMITARDLDYSKKFPHACKDSKGRLRVSAAIGVSDRDRMRAEQLVDAGVDLLTIDTAHGHSQNVIRCVQEIRKSYPDIGIIAGNVATADGAVALADAGVDAVKVGIGPGSICTTRVVTGVGVPQLTAIFNVVDALEKRKKKVRVIADGGIRYSGDIAKALAGGACAVMIGSMFAGTDEAPGDLELYEGRPYKTYRGMGSIGAMSGQYGSKDRYGHDAAVHNDKLVPEGVEGRVPHRGRLSAIVDQLTGGLRASMGYLGCETIEQMRQKAQFIRLTSSGVQEGHVHNVDIVREPPNYPR
jgi:IMP dehydrogenase